MRTPRVLARRGAAGHARTRGRAEPERSTRPASSALSESEDPPPPRGEPPSPYIGFSNDSSCGSDSALGGRWARAAAPPPAAAAARTAASAAAWGTARHASTKCAATSGASPKCRRAYDATTLRQAYPSRVRCRGRRSRVAAPPPSMARTAARTTPSLETFSSISAFEDVVSGRVPRSFSLLPRSEHVVRREPAPPREGVSALPAVLGSPNGPRTRRERGLRHHRRPPARSTRADRTPPGTAGTPRARRRARTPTGASLSKRRAWRRARGRTWQLFQKPPLGIRHPCFATRNAKPPHRRTPRRRRRRRRHGGS